MPTVSAPRFDIDACDTEEQHCFIQAIHALAEQSGWSAEGWLREDRFILTLHVSDREFNSIVRTIRVDFLGDSVLFSGQGCLQPCCNPISGAPGVQLLRDLPIPSLAEASARWLVRENEREIIRHEWVRFGFTHRRWVIADTQEPLVESDSENKHRTALGPPDRSVTISRS